MREKRIGTILDNVVSEASQLEVCPPQKTKEKKSSTSLWSLEAVKIPLNPKPQGKFSSFLAPFVVYLIPNI
jgi:hypothetical protein